VLEGLIDRFQRIRRKILGYGRITADELDSILKDIRVSLLEADVNFRVVKDFIDGLRERCLSLELSTTLKPGDLVVKTVYEELSALLGKEPQHLDFHQKSPCVFSLIGLQGVGKTTTAVKLAVKYKGRNPLLVPADVKRPAAYEQLDLLASRAGIPVTALDQKSAVKTVRNALEQAHAQSHGIVIVDTAGRLHVDDELIQELIEIHQAARPDYRLLVADGMSGQDAVNQATKFRDAVGLDGAILTKMDGDARGGAALSITRAAGVPIYFIGVGENLGNLEAFHPDRIAQRILGMGDLASLAEKVKTVEMEVDQEKMRKKVLTGDLNFEDFLEQMRAVKKLGPLAKLASMIPGVKETDVDENEMRKVEAIIYSMTRSERLHPDLINGSRKRRIAAGSGTTMQDVNQLLKQFKMARDMFKRMGRSAAGGKMPFKLG
jgi:signal recognition particle subunit SRP54